jgi:DNA replication initiation complex subunit (GINS family)|nr:MAG TPA: hypothetical protein [Caudoviricetes sp.]
MTEPYTFEDLSAIYYVELKHSALAEVPKDFYQRVAETRRQAVADLCAEREKDPDSIMCEGAQRRMVKTRRLAEDILRNRAWKVCRLGIQKGMGDDSRLPDLPPEEMVLLLQVAGNYADLRNAMKGVGE